MLKPIKKNATRAGRASFAIVASEYNARYVDSMVRAAKTELKRAGAASVRVVRVPGAYEIPLVAACLARIASEQDESTDSVQPNGKRAATRGTSLPTPRVDAVICLGVILRGETVHAAHIGEALSRALMEIQLRYELPVIHEVLLLENEDQARARCLDKTHNRGREAAQTALAMVNVLAAARR